MKLSTDPETLKIPAFMRKRNLKRRTLQQPLLLTALDRKRAGISIIPQRRGAVRGQKRELQIRLSNAGTSQKKSMQTELFFNEMRTMSPQREAAAHIRPKIKVRAQKQLTKKTPLHGQTRSTKIVTKFVMKPAEKLPASRKTQKLLRVAKQSSLTVGEITHYFDKIKVAVIALKKEVSVGDIISYETISGSFYSQIIDSMEIDRTPVFKAVRGNEIGIKIKKAPKIGGKVLSGKSALLENDQGANQEEESPHYSQDEDGSFAEPFIG